MKGLSGSEVRFADGSVVVADEEYLRASILDPDAKIVDGCPAGIMPQDIGERLTDEQIPDIIAYITTLQ